MTRDPDTSWLMRHDAPRKGRARLRWILLARVRWVSLAEAATAVTAGLVADNIYLAIGLWLWLTALIAFARRCPGEWL